MLFIGILLFSEQIVGLFNSDAELAQVGSRALQFFALFFFIEAVGFPFEVIFTHNGWGRYVLLSEIITNVVCIIGCTLLFTRVFDFGIYGAWSAFALYLVGHSLFMFAGFFSRKWTQTQVDHEWLDTVKPAYTP